MLSEEALILIAAFVGLALLVLGVLEILWPTRPRHPVRHRLTESPRPATPLRPRPAAPPLEPEPWRLPEAAPVPFAWPRHAPPPPVEAVAEGPTAAAEDPDEAPPPEIPVPAEAAAPAVASLPLEPEPLAEPEAEPEPTPAPPPSAAEEPAAPARRRRRSKRSPHARSHVWPRAAPAIEPSPTLSPPVPAEPEREVPTTPVAEETELALPVPVEAPQAEVPMVPVEPAAASAAEEAPAGAGTREIDPLLVETCFGLYRDGHHEEILVLAEEVLRRPMNEPPSRESAQAAAALWSVVGLARQSLGDDEGAHLALEAALAIAPQEEQATYQDHVGALALSTAQTLLARAHSYETSDRISAIHEGLAWIARGLRSAPWNTRLLGLREQARQALGPAYEQVALTLLQRQDFGAARQLLRAALEDPDAPAAGSGRLRELFRGTFGSEIGQLTAQAIRSMQEARESEALLALRRAEELLATVPSEALPPKRREEVDQRLWWGYTKLGVRRVESGEYEEAVDPLLQALRYSDIGPDRQAETRSTLIRALEGVADVRALAIRQLADDGRWDEATGRALGLDDLLRRCVEEHGLTERDLAATLAITRRLRAELGLGNRP